MGLANLLDFFEAQELWNINFQLNLSFSVPPISFILF
jgi:hypothetical protein